MHADAQQIVCAARLALALMRFRSREEWKQLPLDELPPYCEPLLVFDAFDGPVTWIDDWSGKALHSRIELDEIVADQFAYRRSVDGHKRARLARRIRRRWCALVDHAIGYRVPGTVDVLEFANIGGHRAAR